ncbi:MAG: ABC transporter ATP-binding protein [Eubacteriales bacterium]|nr:ABC transporter ATP-binding protein [Eubacteriales bacterium]
MIEVQHLSGGYGGCAVVHDVNLTFQPGSITSLVGPNGCGKSTLLRICAGLQRPLQGDVLLDERPLHRVPREERARRVAYLPQSRPLPAMTVETLVLHGRFPYMGYPRKYTQGDHQLAQEAMEWVGIQALADRRMDELSGGERQKAYLAMLVAQDTDVVFLDEPTTYLDIRHQLEIMKLAQRMKEQGKTVVMVLHDVNMALTCSDTIAVMAQGTLRAVGSPEKIFSSGVLEETFGVRVRRQTFSDGTAQYFFAPSQEPFPQQ